MLTVREIELVRVLTKGLSNNEAAKMPGFSRATVRGHVEHIDTTLEVTNRVESFTKAIERLTQSVQVAAPSCSTQAPGQLSVRSYEPSALHTFRWLPSQRVAFAAQTGASRQPSASQPNSHSATTVVRHRSSDRTIRLPSQAMPGSTVQARHPALPLPPGPHQARSPQSLVIHAVPEALQVSRSRSSEPSTQRVDEGSQIDSRHATVNPSSPEVQPSSHVVTTVRRQGSTEHCTIESLSQNSVLLRHGHASQAPSMHPNAHDSSTDQPSPAS